MKAPFSCGWGVAGDGGGIYLALPTNFDFIVLMNLMLLRV